MVREKDREEIINSLILGFEKKQGVRLLSGQLTEEKLNVDKSA